MNRLMVFDGNLKMNFNVNERTIYLCRHGSWAYGLNTPESDEDFKGICIPPKEFYFGFVNHFEQFEHMGSKDDGIDKVIYSIEKFVKLASEMNPNIIEVLHVDERDVLYMDDFGEWLRDIKNSFLSRKAKHTFSGYAHAQLKRIKTHRQWLLNPPKAAPERKDFGLLGDRTVSKSDLGAFNELERQVGEGALDVGTMLSNLPTNVVEILVKEKAYAAAKTTFEQFKNWEKNRNPVRAELEAKYGYDTKHGSHLLRLMRMCLEILEGKGVIVRRPDRDQILDVKMGRVSYDALIDEAEKLEALCEIAYHISPLPHKADMKFLDAECVKMIDLYTQDYG